MKTVGDLRRALEGVTDDTPLALEFLDDDQLTRMPAGEMGLLLNAQGTGPVFVLETNDTVTFQEMRERLHQRLAVAATTPAAGVMYGQLLDDFRFLVNHEPTAHATDATFAGVEARFRRSMKTLLGVP